MSEKNSLNYYQTKQFRDGLKKLTKREREYFSVMLSQHGVLFIKSKPGIAKSAIARSIAEKMGLQYIDLRLSMADETDMQFPNLTFRDDLQTHVIEHAIPEWAEMSNKVPTLIHFEELNRAPLAVRNAALQILLERGIGPRFKFNQNVFMMSSGNLGDEDGTDVEEFDSAMNNRLVPVEHTLTVKEWLEWGENILHPDIQSFIGFYSEYFYVKPNDNSQQYATPRSWHMLSDYIIKNWGGGPKIDPSTVKYKDVHEDGKPLGKVVAERDFFRDANGEPIHFYDGVKYDESMDIVKDNLVRNWGDMSDYANMVAMMSHSYIGDSAAIQFIKFLEERVRISLKDILANYAKCKIELKKFNRDKYSELLTEATKSEIHKWNPKEIDNFSDFLADCAADERTGFILHIIDNATKLFPKGVQAEAVKSMLRRFKNDLVRIKGLNKENKNN